MQNAKFRQSFVVKIKDIPQNKTGCLIYFVLCRLKGNRPFHHFVVYLPLKGTALTVSSVILHFAFCIKEGSSGAFSHIGFKYHHS